MKIKNALSWASSSLPSSPTSALDAEVLLSWVLQREKTYLLAHPEADLGLGQIFKFKRAVKKRQAGAPVAYVTGRRAFYGLDFEVSERTLIPRPETELLVERAIELNPKKVADVGTGSGCIAVSVAKNLPGAEVLATDVSKSALAVARRNAQVHGANVSFSRGNLLRPLAGQKFDVVIANLPYLTPADVDHPENAGESDDLRREPRLAFLGGPDGLDLYREFFQQLPTYLAPGATVLIEIDPRQADEAQKIARQHLGDVDVKILKDLQGLERVAEATLPEPPRPTSRRG